MLGIIRPRSHANAILRMVFVDVGQGWLGEARLCRDLPGFASDLDDGGPLCSRRHQPRRPPDPPDRIAKSDFMALLSRSRRNPVKCCFLDNDVGGTKKVGRPRD